MKRQYQVKSNLSKTPGIYIISCKDTDKVYVGETINLSLRILKHFSRLRNGRHSNPILLNIYKKYGEASFEVDVLEYLKTTDEVELKTIEKGWQDKYPTCISLDSNIIFRVERSEELKLANKEQLDSIRELSSEVCRIPILVYNVETKEFIEFPSIAEASEIIELKHLYKNILDNILVPYKNMVAFVKSDFTEDKLNDIIIIKSNIGVYRNDYILYNLLNKLTLKFGSKTLFSLHFSSSRNDKLYDNYSNNIDWEFNCTKIPLTVEELFSNNIEIDKTKHKFSQLCNLKLWYESLKIFRNYVHLSELTGLERKKLSKALQLRTKEEWVDLIDAAIARLKSV